MAATVLMVASSQGNGRPKLAPKLAPKPSAIGSKPPAIRQLHQQLPLSVPVSLVATSPVDFSRQKEMKNAGTRGEHSWRGCVNPAPASLTEECRNPGPSPSALNIDSTVSVRRRVKAPKPVPYLEPVVTYLAKDRPTAAAADESSQQDLRRKRVTFAAASPSASRRERSRRQRRAIARANSEKYSRRQRKDLAYLVVDLQSGTIASSFDELWVSNQRQSGRGVCLQRSLTVADPLTREREMSAAKPVPLPRKKPVSSPAVNDCATPAPPTSDVREKPPLAPKPPRKPTPEREEEPTSPSVRARTASAGVHGNNLVSLRKPLVEQKDGSPRPTSESVPKSNTPPPPPPRRDSVLSSSVPPPSKLAAALKSSPPPPALPPKSSPTHQLPQSSDDSNKPPPLPEKTETTRKIQRSIKKPRKEPPPPPPVQPYEAPAQPYEAPAPLEGSFDTHQNDSYGAHVTDDSMGDYEVSDPEDSKTKSAMEEDKPEAMYIDPTQSKQFSSSGKPRPPRPPPPTSSAIKRAQERKRQQQSTSNTPATLKSTGKRLTQRHSNPAIHIMSATGRKPKAKSSQSHPPQLSFPDEGEQLYEELDIGKPSPATSILWRPPSAVRLSPSPGPPAPVEPTTAAPSLPPRSQKSASKTLQRQARGGNKTPAPSEFSRSRSIGDLNSPKETKQVISSSSNKDIGGAQESDEDNEDCVYEPVDTAVPLAPRRTKKNIKGTRTSTSPQRTHGNIYKSHPTSGGGVNSQHGRKSVQETSQSLKITRPEKGKKEEKSLPPKVSCITLEDEGGAEDYVDMDYHESEDKQEYSPDVYVDMQPTSKIVDDQDEVEGSPAVLRPYLRI